MARPLLPDLAPGNIQPFKPAVGEGVVGQKRGKIELRIEGVAVVNQRQRGASGGEEVRIASRLAKGAVMVVDPVVEEQNLLPQSGWQCGHCGPR